MYRPKHLYVEPKTYLFFCKKYAGRAPSIYIVGIKHTYAWVEKSLLLGQNIDIFMLTQR
jgi:hypothetical protein